MPLSKLISAGRTIGLRKSYPVKKLSRFDDGYRNLDYRNRSSAAFSITLSNTPSKIFIEQLNIKLHG